MSDDDSMLLWIRGITSSQRQAINKFCEFVEREAESNMLKTGKLEGAHYAAMRRIRCLLNPKSNAQS